MVHGQGLRLDKWLWFARLTKSRSDAQALCESRHLRLDGRVIDRPSALVRAGSVVSFPQHGTMSSSSGCSASPIAAGRSSRPVACTPT